MNLAPDHVPAPLRHRPRLYAHVAAGTIRQGQRFVLSECERQDALATEWIAAEHPVEVEP